MHANTACATSRPDPRYAKTTNAQPRIPPLIAGLLETVSPSGVVAGWACDAARPGACRVQVMLGGLMLAEAMADRFRSDLLHAGRGHGHYGFAARLRRPLPRGPATLALHLPECGVTAPMAVSVPDLEAPRLLTVEALLESPDGWTTSDLLAVPACLDMAGHAARLGHARFVDAVFRFVLARWPSDAESRMNVDSLDVGRITPEALLLDVLRSRERADMPPRLPSPWAPDFPFPPPTASSRPDPRR